MLKIRLQRVGRRHDPKFRVIVTDVRRGPKSSNFLEILGSYDAKMGNIALKDERIKYWIGEGAQVSDTVHNFLISKGVIEGKKVNALPKKVAIKKEVVEEPAPTPAPAAAPVATPEPVVETPAVEEVVPEAAPVVEEAPVAEAEVKEEAPAEVPAE